MVAVGVKGLILSVDSLISLTIDNDLHWLWVENRVTVGGLRRMLAGAWTLADGCQSEQSTANMSAVLPAGDRVRQNTGHNQTNSLQFVLRQRQL